MKKILSILASFAFVIALVGVFQIVATSPANAACVIRTNVVQVPATTVAGTTHDAKGTFKYRACGNYADILEVSYQVYPGNDDCGRGVDDDGVFYKIDQYVMNGNALNGWNPAASNWNCVTGRQSYTIFKDAPAGLGHLYPTDPAAARCFAVSFKVIINSGLDITKSSPSECVNF